MAGTWTFTITASTSCSQLPVAYRNRSFRVNITQNESGQILGTWIGVRPPRHGYGSGALGGGVYLNTLNFAFGVSDVAANNVVFGALTQSAFGTITGARVSGSFLGSFSLTTDSGSIPGDELAYCEAADHQFVFVRP